MRQYGGATAVCLHSLPPDVTFKEVVVVGNGPSGISASHLLAGHWPYLAEDEPWNRHPIIDRMFVTRLSTADARKSLMVQDLLELADGLEGRIVNPVPLLMDNLLNPCADLGLDLPSMLQWRYKPERQIDHVVLGRGRPGGAWHCFDARVLTLSPARWLRLAGGTTELAGSSDAPLARARVADVASYYETYVAEMGLQRFFRNNTVVTSILPVKCFGHPSDCPGSNCPTRALWCVCGYDSSQDTTFRYLCSRVILATGASDRPNTLETAPATNPGSGHSGDYSAIYSLPALEAAIDRLVAESNGSLQDIPPVLVVGSGLSAADAVVASRAGGLKVAHAYRRSNHAQLATLPQAVYPDYYEVYQMMKDGPAGSHPSYTALPDRLLVHMEPCDDGLPTATSVRRKTVRLLDPKTDVVTEMKVSLCAILIGSRPDLAFLPESFDSRYVTLALDGDGIRLTDNSLKYLDKEVCVQYSFPVAAERGRCPLSRHSFLKTQWHNLKTMVGHGLQGYRIRRKEAKDSKESNCTCGMNKQASERLGHCSPKATFRAPASRDRSRSPEGRRGGLGVGADASKPVDCRSNPVDVDKLTHELRNAPRGLYALGPLTGDNFVRFIPGGALAVVANIWTDKKDNLD